MILFHYSTMWLSALSYYIPIDNYLTLFYIVMKKYNELAQLILL